MRAFNLWLLIRINKFFTDPRIIGHLLLAIGLNLIFGYQTAVPQFISENYPYMLKPLTDFIIISGLVLIVRGEIKDAAMLFLYMTPFFIYAAFTFQWGLTAFNEPTYGVLIRDGIIVIFAFSRYVRTWTAVAATKYLEENSEL